MENNTETKTEVVNNIQISIQVHTSDSEHDLQDDEWSIRQQKLIDKRICQTHRRTVTHWMMRKRCLTVSQVFTLPLTILGSIYLTTPTLYTLLGNEASDPLTVNQTKKSHREIKTIISVVMTSIMTIMAAVVHFFKFRRRKNKKLDDFFRCEFLRMWK